MSITTHIEAVTELRDTCDELERRALKWSRPEDRMPDYESDGCSVRVLIVYLATRLGGEVFDQVAIGRTDEHSTTGWKDDEGWEVEGVRLWADLPTDFTCSPERPA